MVNKDCLTQINNRYMFEYLLKKEMTLTFEKKHPLCMVFFDIYQFKKVNETYGIQVGDDILVLLCKLVAKNLRQNDVLCRWGGDEFVLILPETTYEKAQEIVAKIDFTIQKYKFIKNVAILCNFSVTAYQEEDAFDELVNRMTDRFYEMKYALKK